jgi:hypothetical protein
MNADMDEETPTDEEKIRTYERYDRREVDEKEARAVLGEDLGRLEEDIREFESAVETLTNHEIDL